GPCPDLPRREPAVRQDRQDRPGRPAGGGRDRGRLLLPTRRAQLPVPDARRHHQPDRRRHRAGGLDAHTAAREERADRPAPADLRAEVRAIRAERKYSKDHILELYMNEAYYGNGAYGIQTAAETYFHTTARNLSLRQAALLAGGIRAPGPYDPVAHPDAATARRNLVLERMSELGVIDQADAAKAQA